MDDSTGRNNGQYRNQRSPTSDSRHLLQFVAKRRDLAGPEKYVLLILIAHTTVKNGYTAYPSVNTIHTLTGLDHETIRRSIRALTTAGVIVDIDKSRTDHNSNTYRIDPESAMRAPVEQKRRKASEPKPKDDRLADTTAIDGRYNGQSVGGCNGQRQADIPTSRQADTTANGAGRYNGHEENVHSEDHPLNIANAIPQVSNTAVGGTSVPEAQRITLDVDTRARETPVRQRAPVSAFGGITRLDAHGIWSSLDSTLTKYMTQIADHGPEKNPQKPNETAQQFFVDEIIEAMVIPRYAGDLPDHVEMPTEEDWERTFAYGLLTWLRRKDAFARGKTTKPIKRFRSHMYDTATNFQRVLSAEYEFDMEELQVAARNFNAIGKK